ncbi:YveK family protein, partial [Actinomadura harenae]
MEIDEVAARVIRTYWALLLVATVVPLVAVFLVMSGRTPPAAAQARIVVPGGAAAGAAGDNGVSAAVSTAKAFATGHDLLAKVIKDGRLDRDPDKVAKQIGVKGLGTSAVVELTVKDQDPDVALKLAQSVSAATVDGINTSNQSAIQSQLNQVGQQITALERQQATAAPGPATDRILTQLTDLRTSRSDLRSQLVTTGTASIAQPAIEAPKTDPTVMMTVVAGLGGLVLGILAAVVAEMARPTVPGQRRVARRLDVPLLGLAGGSPAETAALGRRVRLAARKA